MPKEPRQPEAFSLGKFFKRFLLPSSAESKSENENNGSDDDKIRRDFCFLTINGPVYFSTRDEFCGQVSGGLFKAFDLLEYGPQHPLRGWRTTVVGERGGRLWTVDEGSQNAYPLQISNSSAQALIKAKYGFKKIGVNQLSETAPPQGLSEQQRNLLKTLPDLMIRVNHGRTMQHLTPLVSADGTVGWAGVGYVEAGMKNDEDQNDFTKSIVLSISGTAAAQ